MVSKIIHRKLHWLIMLNMVMLLSACQTDDIDYDNLSVDEISSNGFYAYTLPETIVEEKGWSRTIRMNGFDTHCNQTDTIYRENPIWITYKDGVLHQDGMFHAPFALAIGPTPHYLWSSNRETDAREIRASYIVNSRVEYYKMEDSDSVLYRFEDDLGMQVVILSWQDTLGIDEAISLISQLEYDGPNKDTIGNPWERACE